MRSLSLVFLIFALACSKTETPPEPKPDTVPAKAATQKPELPLPVGPAVVELLDAGTPPLQPLRWQLSQGSKSQLRTKSELALEAKMGSQNTPRTVTPSVEHQLSIETLKVEANGGAKMRFEVSEAKVLKGSGAPAQMVAELQRSVASTKGLRGTYELSASGVVRGVDIDKSRVVAKNLQAIDNIEQLVYATSVPVPSEPIGLGAKWKVSRVLEEGGLRVQQVSSYELTKIAGTSFVVGVEVQKTAQPQTVTPPGATSDESYHVSLFDSKGTGRIEGDFTEPVPATSKIDLVSDMVMSTPNPGGSPRELKVMMESSVSFDGT